MAYVSNRVVVSQVQHGSHGAQALAEQGQAELRLPLAFIERGAKTPGKLITIPGDDGLFRNGDGAAPEQRPRHVNRGPLSGDELPINQHQAWCRATGETHVPAFRVAVD